MSASLPHRPFWMIRFADGRSEEAQRWWVLWRLFPLAVLVRLHYPGPSEGYVSRLVRGGLGRLRWLRVAQGASTAPSRNSSVGGQERYRRFPPRWAHIRVPTSSRAAALAGLALYSPCQPKGYLARDVAWFVVRSVGPRFLPGRTRETSVPVPAALWGALQAAWVDQLGPFDSIALYARPQVERPGFAALLLRSGEPVAFVRVRNSGRVRIAKECRVLQGLSKQAVSVFWHPEPLASGDVDGWAFLAITAMPAQRHRPARRERLQVVLDSLAAALQVLPRDAATPKHWVPMHGDFTPWNCRALRDGRLAVLDWEDAQWGPPGADDVLFRASAAALWGSDPGAGPPEAVAYWRERLRARLIDPGDVSLTRRTIAELERMA